MACCKSPSAVNNNTKSIFCDLAYITNTHFLIHLSIKIKAFQSLTPFTQLKVLGKPYARSLRPSLNLIIYTTHLQKSLKTLCVLLFFAPVWTKPLVSLEFPLLTIYFTASFILGAAKGSPRTCNLH